MDKTFELNVEYQGFESRVALNGIGYVLAPLFGCRRLGAADRAPSFGRWTFGRRTFGSLDYRAPVFFSLGFSVATLFRFVARFAPVRIEDCSRNRFALNGIQREFFRGIFSGEIFSGGILSENRFIDASLDFGFIYKLTSV